MNDLSVSSPQPTSPPTISDRGGEHDISDNSSLQAEAPLQGSESLVLAKGVPAALQDSYEGSSAELADPALQLTQQDIGDLSFLANQSGIGEKITPVNNTQASAVLAIFEAYLQNQQRIEKDYTNPGAPHEALTPAYQQEMVTAAGVSSALPFVAATALSTQQNISSEDTSPLTPTTPHEPLRESHEAIGRHTILFKEKVYDKRNPPPPPAPPIDEPTDTATYSNNESLASLRENLSRISVANNLASIEAANVRGTQARNQEEKTMFRKHADDNKIKSDSKVSHDSRTSFSADQPFLNTTVAGLAAGALDTNSAIASEYGGQLAASLNGANLAALQAGLETLKQVTSSLRPGPLGNI